MENTANIWALLCEELEARKTQNSTAEHSAAALKFEEAARHVFRQHPARLRDAYEIAGDIHHAAGAEAEAKRSFEAALGVEIPTQSQKARLATKLAMLCETSGDVRAALRYYQMAVDAHDRALDHAELPTLLNNLAGLHRKVGDAASAVKIYQRALDEAAMAHGPHHPELALIANNFGVACTDSGDLAKAEQMHLRALQIREEIYGSNHPEVGQSLANLAVVYHARGLNGKAERFYQGAIDTLSQFWSKDDPQLAGIVANYQRLPHVHARMLSKTMKL